MSDMKQNTRNINTKYTWMAKCIVLLLIVFSAIGCEKILEKKPSNALLVPSSLQDLQAILDDGIRMNTNLTPSSGEASADDYFLMQNNFNTRLFYEQQLYKWIPADYEFANDWSFSYTTVYNSNLCLDLLKKIDLTPQNTLAWNNVKGSAYFYRAYSFLNLAWNYTKAFNEATAPSDLGIVLRLTSDFNVTSYRSSVKDTYLQIISDAKEAMQNLPLFSIHPYRPSKVGAYGLLARTYLSMRQYDSAFKYSDLALQNKNSLMDLNVNNTGGFLSPASTLPFTQFNIETIFYSEMNSIVTNIAASRALIDTILYNSYNNNDLRKTVYYRTSSSPGYQRYKGSYSNSPLTYFSGIATDELFLIRAECYARAGNKDAALNDLNTLLVKRWKSGFFTPVVASSPNEALDIILLERRKELPFRGLRWIDIKRLNLEGRNIILKRFISTQTFILQPNANYYALPLPTDIISLAGIPQNIYP
jgi:hypothetical protein